jgi:DNA polymerase family A/3'-5' exonuclease
MKPIVLDFETYFDSKTFTLRKMTTEEYVRDDRFYPHLVGIYDGIFDKGRWQTNLQPNKGMLHEIDWPNTAVICHHAQFDCLILNHVFGIRPAFIFDTISMARLVLGPLARLSLSSLAERFGFPEKTVPYNLFDGKHTYELEPAVIRQLGDGCVHDCELTWKIFKELLPHVPGFELELIDKTVRMFTEPALVGDKELLHKIMTSEFERKQKMLNELCVNEKDLQSAAKFVRLLEIEGIEVEYKDGKKGPIPAVAKTDEFMQALLEADNPRVQALAEARIGVRSTITETRSGRLHRMAERGPLCVYLHHAGAHTLRHSGGDKVNLQNLPRRSELRKAICVPEGTLLSVVDFRQIELRTLLWLADYKYWLDFLAKGGNLYCEMATDIFGFPVDKNEHPMEYHMGKETVLGCGYGMGAAKFYKYVRGKGHSIDEELAEHAVKSYRRKFPGVKALWKEGDFMLEKLIHHESFSWKCFHFEDKKAYLSTGSYMHFGQLGYSEEWDSFYMDTRKGRRKIYGAMLVENLNQFLARCVAFEKKLDVGYSDWSSTPKLVMSTHDELGHLVHKQTAEADHGKIMQICEQPVSWMPGLPVAVEGGLYERYEK